MKTRKAAILFALLLCYLYFRGIGDHGLIDPVEGVNASVALHMVAGRNYFVPKIGNELTAGSTMGTWWLEALSLDLFGWSEFAVRFWSALSGLVMILAAALSARSSDDSVKTSRKFLSSWLAACACASMTLCFIASQIASSHAIFSCLTALAMTGVIRSRDDKAWLMLSHTSIAFAFIAHGPAGLFLPFISVIAYGLLCEDWELLIDFFTWPGGIILNIIISGSYYVMLIFINPSVIEFMVCRNHNYTFGGILGIIVFVIVGFAPFHGFLLRALYEIVPRKYPASKSPELFMFVWAVVFAFYAVASMDILTLAACVPALSALLGRKLDFWLNKKFLSVRYSVMFNILISIPLFYIALPLMMNYVPVIKVSLLSLIPYEIMLGLFLIACWYYTKTRQITKWMRNVSAAALLCLMPIAGVFNLTAEEYGVREIGLKLRDLIRADDIVLQYEINFPSLYFYTLRNTRLINCELTPGVTERRFVYPASVIEPVWTGKNRAFLIIPTDRSTDSVMPKNIFHILESHGMLLLSNQ